MEIIKDSTGRALGYIKDTFVGREYWGYTKGFIGRFTNGRWWWANGNLGPMCDIGYGEVYRAEGGK